MLSLSGAIRARMQSAVDAGVCSAAAFALARTDGSVHTVAAGRNSRIRQRREAGRSWCEPAPGAPIDDRALFDLASLTKPLCTTTLLAQAVGCGGLDLATPLSACLTDAADQSIGNVQLRHLLAHTSGWPAWIDFFAATAALADPLQRAAEVRRQVLATPLVRQPGSAAVYSDLGFLALGWVLEAAAGQSLDQLFAHQVAAPLGASLVFAPLGQPTLAAAVATEIWAPRCGDGRPLQGIVHDDNCAALGGIAGHAGLFGSATDVGRWAAAWLGGLRGGANPLRLDTSQVRQWTTTPACTGSSWRLGFDTPTPPGSTAGDCAPADTVGHLGFTGTSIWLAPSMDVALVLLTNRVHPSRDDNSGIKRLRNELHDLAWSALRAAAPWSS